MVTILDGNAFYLRIAGITKTGEHEVSINLNVIDSLIVNFVRRVRESQALTLDQQGRALAYNPGHLAKGVYGVEMVGYYNGQPWRFFAPDVFVIADTGETEASATIGSVEVYDVTFYMKLGGDGVTSDYVDAVMLAHNADQSAHPIIQDAITGLRTQVERRLVGAKVTFSDGHTEDVELGFNDQGEVILLLPKETFGKIDGVSVNGIELEVDENGKVDIPIPTTVHDLDPEDEYATKEEAQAMVDEAKVTGATLDYQEDGGSPSASVNFSEGSLGFTLKNMKMRFSDLSNDEKEELRGPQGIPGQSVIVGEGDLPLERYLSQADNKAVTPKAVGEGIIKATKYDLEEVDVSEVADNAYYITSYTKKWTASSGQYALRRTRLVPVTSGRYLLKKEAGVISNYTVLKSNNYAPGTVADFASGYTGIYAFNEENEIEIVVPTGGTLLYYFSQKDNGDTVKINIYKIGESALAQEIGNDKNKAISQDAATRQFEKSDIKTDYGESVSEDTLLTSANTWVNNKYFNSSGTAVATSAWKACADIYVSNYDFVRVSLCDVSSLACIIFVDANNQCITEASIAGAGIGIIQPYYREIVVKVPTNAVRLGISALMDESTYGTPYCYGQKYSGGIIKANETREILDKDRLGEVQVVKAPQWINGYIGSDGQGHITNDYWLTYPIKADKVYSIRSIAATPVNLRVNYYDKNLNHLGLVGGGTEITSLAMECYYIRIWFDNDGTPPDTQLEIKKYVGGNSQYPRLDGKAIVTFGDSITWYDIRYYNNGDEQGTRVKGYQSYMREIGMMVDNQGISGYTMPQIYNEEVLPYTRFGVVDYVTIFSGANDSKNGVAVGEVAEIGSTFNTATYIGALQAIIEYILNINTQVKIVLFTPIKGWNYRSGVPPMTKREYVDAVKAVGKVYSLPVIDIYDTIGLNEITRDAMINDPEPTSSEYDSSHPYSLHPSTYGYKRMADVILPQLAQV